MPSSLLEARLSRYSVAAGAIVAAIPTQAAPITVILPTPVNLSSVSLQRFDVDQDGVFDLNFTAIGGGAFFPTPSRFANFVASGSVALQLTEGVLIDKTGSGSLWGNSVGGFLVTTAVSPTFLGFRFGSSAGGPLGVGFAQFSGTTLYGFAWDEANTITTFDITAAPTAVPEPATGALAALALGVVALAARKRKQA